MRSTALANTPVPLHHRARDLSAREGYVTTRQYIAPLRGSSTRWKWASPSSAHAPHSGGSHTLGLLYGVEATGAPLRRVGVPLAGLRQRRVVVVVPVVLAQRGPPAPLVGEPGPLDLGVEDDHHH